VLAWFSILRLLSLRREAHRGRFWGE